MIVPCWTSVRPAGGAGAVVQCAHRLSAAGTHAAPYREGSVGHTPEGALDDAANSTTVRVDLLHLERRDGRRALFTSVYGGRVAQALVVRYGPAAPGTGADSHGNGWWPESLAACDLAEWPEAASTAQGVEVWTDRASTRVDTRRVMSWTDNGDGCLGDDVVQVGARIFVRAPSTGADRYYRERYEDDRRLPTDAVETGWSRDGRQLWLSSTRARAYVGRDAAHVEFWPQLTGKVGCG